MKEYVNLDLELFDYRRDGTQEGFRARVAGSPAGEMGISEAVECALARDFRASLQALLEDRLEQPKVIELGGRLGELLLPAGPVSQLFERSLGRLKKDQGLRLRLRIEAPELASIPWELAYLPLPGARVGERDARGFLGLQSRLSLVRHELLSAPLEDLPALPEPRLVCVLSGARSAGLPALDLDREERSIRAGVEAAGIQMVALTSATLAGLQSALDGGAHLFHYAGHGIFDERMGEIPRTSEGEGYLLLEGAAGGPLEVPAEQVGRNLAAANVRLALLNGCETGRRDAAHSWTGIAPALAQQGVPAVLANQFKVSDEAAIELSRRFYEKLATGEPVDAAVTAARLALSNLASARPRDFATPVLYLRLAEDSDGVLLPKAPAEAKETAPPNRWFWLNLALLAGLIAGVGPWLASRYFGWNLLAGSGAGVVTLFAAWGIVDRLAGEHLNTTLRAWLMRPLAAVWLSVLIACGGLAAALAPPPGVMVLLIPFDRLISRLPLTQSSGCSLRLSVDGVPKRTFTGLWKQAVFLAPSEEAVTQRISGGAMTKTLLAMKSADGLEVKRRDFYDILIERRHVEPLRLDADDRLRVKIVEPSPSGNETVLYDAEQRVGDLKGEDVRVWFLEGDSK